MRYMGISKEDLGDLHRALDIFGEVYSDTEFQPWLYALINSGVCMESAVSILKADYEEFQEEEYKSAPSAIAVLIPLTSGNVHLLTGSGLPLDKEEFAFINAGEGSRSSDFHYANPRPKLFMNDIQSLAVSETDAWVHDFLEAHAPEQQPSKPQEVIRNESIQSSLKTSGIKGIDKVLLAGQSMSSLKVTELIEIADFVDFTHRGVFLHYSLGDRDWLVWSDSPAEGEAAFKRLLQQKLDMDDLPEVTVATPEEEKALIEAEIDTHIGSGDSE